MPSEAENQIRWQEKGWTRFSTCFTRGTKHIVITSVFNYSSLLKDCLTFSLVIWCHQISIVKGMNYVLKKLCLNDIDCLYHFRRYWLLSKLFLSQSRKFMIVKLFKQSLNAIKHFGLLNCYSRFFSYIRLHQTRCFSEINSYFYHGTVNVWNKESIKVLCRYSSYNI